MAKKRNKKKFVDVPTPVKGDNKLTSPILPRGSHRLDRPHFREEKPSISLKYVDLGFKSFEDLRDGHNLKEWDSFLRKFNNSPDWSYVFRIFQRDSTGTAKANEMMKALGMDPDQTEMIHIRVTDEFRIHGFMKGNRFKLIWLDPHHEINKM